MKICVTGHRPSKMFGYNIYNKLWVALKERFKRLLIENNCHKGVTGMALGTDMVFALAVLELKEEGYDIELHCALPCRNHSCKWPKESRDLYNSILERADSVVLVSDEEYKPWLLQRRNEYMVDLVDKVIAVWDGSSGGGTANCVRYAKKQGKDLIIIEPSAIRKGN